MATARHDRLKVGVVGASIAHSPDGRERFAVRAHVPALKALSDIYDLAAVCTSRMETAKEAAERYDVPHAFDGVERMLREIPDLDIVCVCVNPASHYQVAMPALEAGKHVYCEHPGGISTQQARAMWEMAQRQGVRTMSGHQHHFDPTIAHMGDLLQQGLIGRPLLFGMSMYGHGYIHPRPYFHRWLFELSAGGRPGYRSGHSLEQIMSILHQDVAAVCADFTIQVPERPALDRRDVVLHSDQVDTMNYLLRMNQGTVGTLQASNAAWFGTGERFEVYGSEGMLALRSSAQVAALRGEPLHAEDTPFYNVGPEYRLYGARADVENILNEQLPPESSHGRVAEIEVPERTLDADIGKHDSAPYRVARAWVEFAAAIHEGRECSPSLHDTYKIHRIWDAAEESVRTRAWVDVDYT